MITYLKKKVVSIIYFTQNTYFTAALREYKYFLIKAVIEKNKKKPKKDINDN